MADTCECVAEHIDEHPCTTNGEFSVYEVSVGGLPVIYCKPCFDAVQGFDLSNLPPGVSVVPIQ